MKKLFVLSFLITVVLSPGALFAQDAYYVQSLKAKVLAAPSFKSKVLGEASRGTKLASSGREGGWVKVSYYNKEGYVSSLLVSTYPPIMKKGLIKGGEEAEIKQSVRRRASTYTSAAAARGLAADDRRRLSREEKVDYESLEKIEALALSEDEVTRFAEGGKL